MRRYRKQTNDCREKEQGMGSDNGYGFLLMGMGFSLEWRYLHKLVYILKKHIVNE